ncbi:hypothetical protein KJ605_02960 [Patescibacteria group bacterium]|nr:hypothetical protein [Patescibacteria group bacterium]MBU1970703.1 hypothetical protein [Patescibacteria group bacterium]
MNKNPVQDKIEKLIFGLILGLVFLVPVFFLTVTNEFFEFNKLYLFVVATGLLALLWCVKMLVEKKVYLAKSPLDLPLLLILTAFILSTVTSLDKTASLFGSYGRWFPSLLGFVTLYVFYYLASTSIDSAKKIRLVLYTLAGSSTIPALLGLFNYAGLVLPFMNLLNQRGFLLTGTSSSLSVVAMAGTVLCGLLAVNIGSTLKKLLFIAAFLVNFIATAVFGGVLFLMVAVVIVALGLMLLPTDVTAANKRYLFPMVGVIAAFAVLYFIVPQTRSVLQADYPKDVALSLDESWIISSTAIRDFPILGSGVSTFYLDYPRYRTLEQNYTPTWNINFDKPTNEFFNIISTMGIFGLAAFGFLVAAVIKVLIRSTKVNDAYKGLSGVIAAGVLTALTALLLTYASFQTMFILFILLALTTAEAVVNNNKSWAKLSNISLESRTDKHEGALIEAHMIYKKEILQYIVALPVAALAAFGMYQGYRQYAAELFMRRAILAAAAQNAYSSYDYQVKAIVINPNRSQYHRLYANTNLSLAQSLSTKSSLTDQEKVSAQNMLAQALRNIKFATENLNPLDSLNWLTRAQIYRFLIPAATDADQFAIQAYNTAISLNPTNPGLRVELGSIYYGKEDYLTAGNLFKQAVNLKNDYANAHYNLAHTLVKLNAFNDAKAEFELVQNLVESDSADYQLVAGDLENVNKQLEAIAGAQTENKPTVQALEQTGQEPVEPAEQEPLTKPE